MESNKQGFQSILPPYWAEVPSNSLGHLGQVTSLLYVPFTSAGKEEKQMFTSWTAVGSE